MALSVRPSVRSSVHPTVSTKKHRCKWQIFFKFCTQVCLGVPSINLLFVLSYLIEYAHNSIISDFSTFGIQRVIFIRPFEKRDVLCRGNVRPSVCPSVCPSVRPSVRVFRTFLQHALRYQFETWYINSVGGTTCRVWVASQLGHFDLVYSQK